MSLTMFTGDLEPDLIITLSADDPVNVTSAASVRILGRRGDDLVFDRAPTTQAVNGATSVLTMEWQPGDTDLAGLIGIEVEVTWPGSRVQTFRPDAAVRILADFDQTTTPGGGGSGTAAALTDTHLNAILVNTASASRATVHAIAQTQQGRPSYAPATATNGFDPATNVYNYKPSNTRRLRAGLGRAMVGGACEMMVIGASGETGWTGTTYDTLRAWPLQMRDEIARHGVPVAGTGVVRNRDAGMLDSRWTFSGTWTANTTYSFTVVNGATTTFTSNLAGNRTTVGYYDYGNGTAFTISVNGASSGAGFTSIAENGPVGWKQVTLNAGPAVGQTVVLTKLSGTTLTVRGVSVWSTTGGLIVHNVAQSSSQATGTGVTSWTDLGSVSNPGVVFSSVTSFLTVPDLVIIALGGNDKAASVSDATLTAALTTLRNRYPTSDALLVAGWQMSDGLLPAATWETTLGAYYTLADTLDVPLVDQRARLGNWTQVVANGLNGDALAHLKAEAFADLGRSVGKLLAS